MREIEITIASSFPDKITQFWLADSSVKESEFREKIVIQCQLQ